MIVTLITCLRVGLVIMYIFCEDFMVVDHLHHGYSFSYKQAGFNRHQALYQF
jgi:hypothetical protein